MIKVSVIIPVYNAQKNISKCLESLLRQTEKAIEIIIIDDGSTDQSYQIIKNYANEDKRIIPIHQTNRGVSKTRNKGIDTATGKYIMFVDADDQLKPHAISELYQLAESQKVDLIRFEYDILFENSQIKKPEFLFQQDGIKTKEKMCELFIETGKLNSVWLDFIKKDIFFKHKLRFPEDMIFAEDMLFNLELISKVDKIYYTNKIFYHYFVNPEGISNSHDLSKVQKKIENSVDSYSCFFDYLVLWDMNTKLNQQKIANKILTVFEYELRNIFLTNLSFKEKKEYVKKINNKVFNLYSILDNEKLSYRLKLLKAKKYKKYSWFNLLYWKLKQLR